MAWRQELELLTHLSTATCTEQFISKQPQIEQLLERVEAESQTEDGLKRLLSDGVFLRALFSAESAGLLSVCTALESGALMTPVESSCMESFFEVLSGNLLKQAMLSLTLPHAASALARGSSPMPPGVLQMSRMLTITQGIIKETGFLHSLPRASSASAAAISNALQVQSSELTYTTACKAALAGIRPTECLSRNFLSLWADLGMIWGCAEYHKMPDRQYRRTLFSWVDPELQTTIAPGCSLVMALMRLEAACTSPTEEYRHPAGLSNMISEPQAFIWDAVASASATLGQQAMNMFRNSCLDVLTNADAATAGFLAMVQNTGLQDLQLYLLAAVAGGLHRKHKGQPQAQLLEPSLAAPCSDAIGITGSNRKGRKICSNSIDKQQPLAVPDFSPQLLQHLGLSEMLGQQLYEMFAPEFDGSAFGLEVVARFAPVLLACGVSDRLFDSIESSKLPLLKVQLVSQLIALYPKEPVLPGALRYLTETAIDIHKYQLTSGALWNINGAAEAVGDSILAPLLLQVGPAVLQNDEYYIQHWAIAVQRIWIFVQFCMTVTRQSDDTHQYRIMWQKNLQQQPFTAVAVFDSAVRAANHWALCAAAELELEHSPNNANQPSLTTASLLVLIEILLKIVPASSELLAARAAARHVGSTFRHVNKSPVSSLVSFDSHNIFPQPLSFVISCLKCLDKSLTSEAASFQDKMGTVKLAMVAFDTAKQLVAATGSNSSSRPSAVALLWFHAAGRALHVCSNALLWTAREAAADPKKAQSRLQIIQDSADLCKFFILAREGVEWCQDQLASLAGTDDCSAQSNDHTDTRNNISTAACFVPRELLKQLLKQSQQLQHSLGTAQRHCFGIELIKCDKAAFEYVHKEGCELAEQLQQYSAALCACLPTVLCCNNPSCSRVTGVSELACVGKRKCSKCQAAGYCSRQCQTEHWSQHKKMCSWLWKSRST